MIKLDDNKTKTIPNNIICETKSFYILHAFLLTRIVLLMVVSIYCYLIKYKSKQSTSYDFIVTSQITNQKKLCIDNIN